MSVVHADHKRLPTGVELVVAAGAILRRLRHEPRLLALATVVCLASLVLAGIPRYLNGIADRGMRAAVAGASVQQSGITVTLEGRIGLTGSGDSFGDFSRRGDEYRAGLPPSLQQVISDATWLIESPRFQPITSDGHPLYADQWLYPSLYLRYDEDVWEHVTIVEGREPQPRPPMTPRDALGVEIANLTRLSVFEIALTRSTADALGLSLNGRILMTSSLPPSTTAVSAGSDWIDGSALIEVAAIVEVNDMSDPYWFGDRRLHGPDISRSGDTTYIYARGIPAVAEDVYADIYANTIATTGRGPDWTHAWRYAVDPDAFDSGLLDDLGRDLRNVETTNGPFTVLMNDPSEVSIQTQLPNIIDDAASQYRTVASMLTLSGIALLAMAGVLIVLLAILIVERQRATIVLLRGRGASARQLIVAQLGEGMLICLPASVVGWMLAERIIAGRSSDASLPIALGVAGVTVLLVVAVALTQIVPPLGALARGTTRSRAVAPARLVGEGAVIVVAGLGVVLLRRRGITTGDTSPDLTSDPLLAAVPVLIALAAGIITLRLLPLVFRGLATLVRRRRGLVVFLALRRSGEQPTGAGLPVLAVVLAVAVSSFSQFVTNAIRIGQEHAALQAVGADYQVRAVGSASNATATGLPDTVVDRIATIEGVDAVAPVTTFEQTRLVRGTDGESSTLTGTVVLIDPASMEAVTDGTVVEAGFPGALTGASASGVLPALAARSWMDSNGVEVGEELRITLADDQLAIRLVGVQETVPGLDLEEPALYVDRDAYLDTARTSNEAAAPALLLVRGERGLIDTIGAATGAAPVEIVAREELLRVRSRAPFSAGLSDGFQMTTVMAALAAALAALIALAITIRSRASDLAFLRTLGLSARQALGLAVLEHLPPVIVAATIGGLLGVATAGVVEPGIDLTAFTSAPRGVPLTHGIDPLALTVMTLAIVGTSVAVVIAAALVTRRAHLGETMRIGQE